MLRVRVLGGVSATCDGRLTPEPGSRRAVALLGWLALHPGLRSRAEVAAALWPDVVDASARQSMRSALWSLRQVLPDEALLTTRDRVGLHADVDVDVREFDALVAAGDVAAALDVDAGELLAGLDDEWALIARDEHRARVGALLRGLVDTTDDRRQAVAWARRAVELDPLSEESARLLMTSLAAAGDNPAALAVYRTLGDRLRRALRVSPAEETWRLAESIRTRAAAGPATRTRAGLLPLVGRDRELAALAAAWTATRAGHGGMALVHGEPGIGKTRLIAQLVETAGAATVAVGAAPELPGPPLALWVDVCGALLRRLDHLPNAPWVAALAPLLPAHVPPDPVVVAPALEQARLAEAVVALITECARREPVLLVIEDVHAADDASLAMLAHVVRRAAEGRTLVVVTRRTRPRRDRLDALEQASRQNGLLRTDIALVRLDTRAIARLARLVGELDDAAVGAVVRGADGSPLLAVEAARALAGI
jgi:DNA-binding SARP family transcriptional activator